MEILSLFDKGGTDQDVIWGGADLWAQETLY